MRKKLVNAKLTKVDGIQFLSGLEANFYKKLKAAKIKMDYEKWSYELAPNTKRVHNRTYKKWGNKFIESKSDIKPITYTPDFVINNDDYLIVVECKGRPNERYPVIRSLFLRYLEGLGIKTYFFEPRNPNHNKEVIEHIKEIIA